MIKFYEQELKRINEAMALILGYGDRKRPEENGFGYVHDMRVWDVEKHIEILQKREDNILNMLIRFQGGQDTNKKLQLFDKEKK